MRRVLIALVTVLAGLALGIGSAAGVLVLGFDSTWVHYGPWRTNPLIGRAEAGMYTRARVAVGGVLALPTSEVLYLLSERDDEGMRLRAACRYRVSGGSLPARWWSLTVYGSDRFLVANAEGRYSYTSSEVGERATWTVTLARDRAGRFWLPAGARDQNLMLVLRLYHVDEAWAQHLGQGQAPRILREGCA